MLDRLLLVTVVGVLGLGCGAAPPDPSGPICRSQQAIEAAAVREVASPSIALARAGVPFCSGTLVAPRVIVTAAHCLSDGAGNVQIVFASRAGSPGMVLDAAAQLVHPAYDAITLDNDVAAITLAADAPIVPARLAPVTSTLTRGALVSLSGWAALRHETGAHALREGLARVGDVEKGAFRTEPAPATACAGDSGGSVFDASAETPLLVGVISSTDLRCVHHTRAIGMSAVHELLARLPAPGCEGT